MHWQPGNASVSSGTLQPPRLLDHLVLQARLMARLELLQSATAAVSSLAELYRRRLSLAHLVWTVLACVTVVENCSALHAPQNVDGLKML